MTGLHRTELSTPLKAQLAASAFALQGHHGAVSALAADFEVSRPTVYAASGVAESVLVEHFAREEAGADGVWIFVDRAQLERSIVGLRSVAPVSLRNIEELIPIIYPKVTRSFGLIQSVCAEAERRAHRHNQSVDLSQIDAAALDELFSQRQPVLAGVDLDTGYCFGVSLEDHRGGDQRLGATSSTAPGLALHMKALRKALTRIARKYKALAVRLAVMIHRLHGELPKARYQHQRRERQQMLAAVWLMLRREAGNQAGEVLAAVSEVMSKRHRASSAIEGFNAGLRPYLYVHRGVSQGFLELFQAYQNLRTRR